MKIETYERKSEDDGTLGGSKSMKSKYQISALHEALNEIWDEADHIIGTEADNHREVAISDARSIKQIIRKVRKDLPEPYDA